MKLSAIGEILPPAATTVFILFLFNQFCLVKIIQESVFISLKLTDARLNYAPFKKSVFVIDWTLFLRRRSDKPENVIGLAGYRHISQPIEKDSCYSQFFYTD